MSRRNKIVITEEPRGRFIEGVISGTPLPGTIMQIQAGTAVDGNGHHTFVVYNRDADGNRPQGPHFVLREPGSGRNFDTAYITGSLGFMYVPLPGDELNLRWSEAGTGTGDAVAVGDLAMVDDGSGLLVDTSSPEVEPFMAMEAKSDVVATGTLVWCMATGY